MNADPTDPRSEVVIVRRKGGGDGDGHHGGAWKIAYADFVTAMMAFFLVMWLINASNEATRAQVASYFNPIKLTDSSTAKRGLQEPKETLKKKQPPSDGESVADGDKVADEMTLSQEDKLLHDPHRILESLAAKDPTAKKLAATAQAEEPADLAKLSANDTLLDPFDPVKEVQPQEEPPPPSNSGSQDVTANSPEVSTRVDLPPEAQRSRHAPPLPEEVAEAADSRQRTGDPEEDKSPEQAHEAQLPPADGREPAATERLQQEKLAKTAEIIRAEILSRMGAGNRPLPANLDVEATSEGILISLTDKHEFGMFALGSAEPNPRLVTLIATIAEVLKNKPGFVVVRGHTDARPYRNKKYDNWQLSSARAQMAVYMLERGGLDQSRVKRVEGYADRSPKVPEDPESEENRRIEILLGGLAP